MYGSRNRSQVRDMVVVVDLFRLTRQPQMRSKWPFFQPLNLITFTMMCRGCSLWASNSLRVCNSRRTVNATPHVTVVLDNAWRGNWVFIYGRNIRILFSNNLDFPRLVVELRPCREGIRQFPLQFPNMKCFKENYGAERRRLDDF